MRKHVTKLTNLNDELVEVESYFNLNAKEALELNDKYGGDLEKYWNEQIKNENASALLNALEDIVLSAYGKKSEDGLRFIKSDEIREEFKSTLEFDQIILDLLTTPDLAQEFIKQVIPTLPEGHKTKGKGK